MEIKEIIITTCLAVVGLLSYKHYDFYKSAFKYIAVGIVIYTLLHFLWYMALGDLLKTIQYDIKPTKMIEIKRTFEVYRGNISNTLWTYAVSLSVLGILYASPQIIKSHPYNTIKKNGTDK